MRTLGLVALAFLLCGCPKQNDPFAVGKTWTMVSDLPGAPVTTFQVGSLTPGKSYCVFGVPMVNNANQAVDLYISKTNASTYINAGSPVNAHVWLWKDLVQGPVIFEVLIEDMNTRVITSTVYYGHLTTDTQLPDRLLGVAGGVSKSHEIQVIDKGFTDRCPSQAELNASPGGVGPWTSAWDTNLGMLRGQYAENGDFGGCYVEQWWYSSNYLERLSDYRTTNCATSRFTLTRVK